MKTLEAQTLALEEMRKWDLLVKGWTFSFDQRKKRFGSCSHFQRRITLSAPLTLLNPTDEVLDTIRHEIAHALAGHLAGHGPVWKAHCGLVGCRPEKCYDNAKVVQPDMNYEAICATCGRVAKRDRLPRRTQACGRCCKTHAGGRFDRRFILNYYRTGTQPRPVVQPLPTVPKPPVVGVLNTWQNGQYVPVAQIQATKVTITPAAPEAGMVVFDAAKVVELYKAGTKVVDIAVTIGYKRGQGQNRVRAALVKAGVYTDRTGHLPALSTI